MSEDNKMDCFSNERKTKIIDIELKDEQRMEEQNMEIELKTSIEDEAEAHADPLQDQTTSSSNFCWLFKDEDILLNEEQLDSVLLKPGTSRSKRGRPLNNSKSSLSSSSGHAWSLEDNAQDAAQAELLVPKHVACGKGPARNVSNAVEAWMLLFDDEMLRLLQTLLNKQIRQRRSRTHAERLIDLTELRSWLGLCYLCGVFRNAQHNGPLDELWTVELGNVIFRATMSLARFEFLTDCLSVPCASSLKDEQHLWQKLLINCRSYYGASGWLCVDAQPVLHNTSLPLCCDAKTLYMTNAVLSSRESTPSKELMQLICDYKTTGRNITLGKRYASLKHAQQLHAHNLSSICTLDVNSPDYPKNWTGNALFSGVHKLTKQSTFSLLSSGLSSQLNALRSQTLTSQTCEHLRELLSRFSTALSLGTRLTVTQPASLLRQLHLMLNVSALNAWVLLRLSPKGDALMEQRDFQRQLGLFLAQQRLQRRLQRNSTRTTLMMRLQICEILGQSTQRLLSEAASAAKQTQCVGKLSLEHAKLPEGLTLASRYGEKHRRCKPCARNKRETKSRSRCQQCQMHRCGNHLISRCYECMGLTTAQLPEGNIKDS